LLVAFAPALATTGEEITPEDYLAHVKYLASPELKGRLTGSPELNQAAEYIAAQFSRAHLEPLGASYFQDFEVTATTALDDDDAFSFQQSGKSTQLKQGSGFIPLNLSGNGKATGAIVFAGYGISAPKYHYDDYAGVDVRDKIVIMLRHEPQENDPNSVFEGKNLTEHALFSSKVANAKLHGAKAVLIVNDFPNHPGEDDRLLKFEPLMATQDYGILVDQISVRVADQLLGSSHKSLQHVITDIDRELKPESFVLEPAHDGNCRS
jgi:hypothetical protein